MGNRKRLIVICAQCDTAFSTSRLDAKYCNGACRVQAHREAKRGMGKTWNHVSTEHAAWAQTLSHAAPEAYAMVNKILEDHGASIAQNVIEACVNAYLSGVENGKEGVNAYTATNDNQGASGALQSGVTDDTTPKELANPEYYKASCPVCMNECYHCVEKASGKKLGFKRVGERKLAVYGEFLWDKVGEVHWHMSVENNIQMTDSEVLSHYLDDLSYVKNGGY